MMMPVPIQNPSGGIMKDQQGTNDHASAIGPSTSRIRRLVLATACSAIAVTGLLLWVFARVQGTNDIAGDEIAGDEIADDEMLSWDDVLEVYIKSGEAAVAELQELEDADLDGGAKGNVPEVLSGLFKTLGHASISLSHHNARHTGQLAQIAALN
ncbi:MAG: hypothetical protein IIB61_03875 [Planctomycetes bacterium]|nr:hypothetical protein [Planctomycetota bacterium]